MLYRKNLAILWVVLCGNSARFGISAGSVFTKEEKWLE
jgi:hypothetical protein